MIVATAIAIAAPTAVRITHCTVSPRSGSVPANRDRSRSVSTAATASTSPISGKRVANLLVLGKVVDAMRTAPSGLGWLPSGGRDGASGGQDLGHGRIAEE